MQERRAIPRWEIRQEILLKPQDQDPLKDCYLEDMNLEGMSFSLPEPLPYGMPLRVNLLLKDGLLLNVQIRLCWEKELKGRHYYGAHFNAIFNMDEEAMNQYISSASWVLMQKKWTAE